MVKPPWLPEDWSTGERVPPPKVMHWHHAKQDAIQDLPPSRVMSPLRGATCLDKENVSQPKERFPRVSFAKTPTFLQDMLAMCRHCFLNT